MVSQLRGYTVGPQVVHMRVPVLSSFSQVRRPPAHHVKRYWGVEGDSSNPIEPLAAELAMVCQTAARKDSVWHVSAVSAACGMRQRMM